MRIERDSMGEVAVPAWAYWGAQTQRAVENFPVSGYRFGRFFIEALGLVKQAAARVNAELGRLDPKLARAIAEAAGEVAEGKLDEHFVVDVFQTGSGTSTHMNTNEVIANRAIEILGGELGSRTPVHPNDHVNMGQSSNDVIPSTLHVAACLAMKRDLLPALEHLRAALGAKAQAFDAVVKIGRTHLQDATPIRLGQEFSGYAAQIELSMRRIEQAMRALRELPVGGTAVGTGLNAHPEFGRRLAEALALGTGIDFVEAANHFEAQAAKDGVLEASGMLRCVAGSLAKIASDIRLLASGPRCGIGELELPALQPGSSIMPGKVNPVIPEMVVQVAYQVMGNDFAISLGCRESFLELNVAIPLIAWNLLESIRLLSGMARLFANRCIAGMDADKRRAEELVERSLALVTGLARQLGYDRAAAVAKEAYRTGKSVREVVREQKLLSDAELEAALDPRAMTEPR
ncbi:MAG: class II fumarate hydratase [Planctomycetota bacterium]